MTALSFARSDCASPEAVLAFVQGTGSAEDRHLVERHIDACEPCRRLVSAAAMSPLVSVAAQPTRSRREQAWERVVDGYSRIVAPLARGFEAVTPPTTEEDRAVFQRRLAVLAAVCGALAGAALLFSLAVVGAFAPRGFVAYATHPHQAVMLATIVVFLVGWRWLRRSELRILFPALRKVDAVGTIGLAGVFATNAAFESASSKGALTAALAVGHLMIVRAIVVPSTGRHTLAICIVSMTTALGLEAGTIRLGPAPTESIITILALTALWLTVSTIAASFSSRIIFGLRGEAARLRVAGHYRLHEKLGAGSMGTVFRATHTMLRRAAAIKLLPPESGAAGARSADFEREVRLTATLRHPNTITVFDYGRTTDGAFYYAMEYIEGSTLQELVERIGPLPPGRVAFLLDQVLASLGEAHALGLVHRDIKPANVMVLGTVAPDSVKVLDFGLAQAVSREGEHDGKRKARGRGRLVGTPAYISPERLGKGGAATPASDLYSVAAVGYFLVTGTTVFRADTVAEMLRLHVHAAPDPPATRLGHEPAAELSGLLLSGLAKAPGERPSSAEEFRQRLRRCALEPWSENDARSWWQGEGLELLPQKK